MFSLLVSTYLHYVAIISILHHLLFIHKGIPPHFRAGVLFSGREIVLHIGQIVTKLRDATTLIRLRMYATIQAFLPVGVPTISWSKIELLM